MRLIDADELMKEFEANGTWWEQARLEEEPTIEANPVVHGHWIIWEPPDELSGNMQRGYVCSECKRNVAFILHGVQPLPPYMFGRMIFSYCPYCGANMEE